MGSNEPNHCVTGFFACIFRRIPEYVVYMESDHVIQKEWLDVGRTGIGVVWDG